MEKDCKWPLLVEVSGARTNKHAAVAQELFDMCKTQPNLTKAEVVSIRDGKLEGGGSAKKPKCADDRLQKEAEEFDKFWQESDHSVEVTDAESEVSLIEEEE